MALKADRQIDQVELGYFFKGVSDRGYVLCYNTAGSGVAMDNSSNVAKISGTPSGVIPLGLLLNDFVNIDRTRLPVNWHKDQQVSGDKATLLTVGWAVTNAVVGTVTAGMEAVLAANGNISGVSYGTITNKVNTPPVGRFITGVDEAGYAKVAFNFTK